ncbi:tetratricopeptide repeat protein [Oscillatoria sp. CS-180]|uniref:tetratricopeptide repeat protein n=1 Tax=Oscillatoria sp. CS-180 TaxID=3021720 RepID=UPI00232FC99D|nr:tetratricopeptide repeat protein [Oscillatoria sp. CS-180]MDB9525391.1 tetratricopeptide repeat protein [Oscillatoria sp. CS-180]
MVDQNATPTPADRYSELIESIIALTLKGKIRSKEQVFQMLQSDIEPQEGGDFADCLDRQISAVETVLTNETDALQQAKATRRQRALKTIHGEFDRWQKENQSTAVLSGAIANLIRTQSQDRLSALLQVLDPNQPDHLNRDQIKTLAQQLRQLETEATAAPSLQELSAGLTQGLATWQQLEGHVISWVYDQAQRSIGFGSADSQGPWPYWAKQVGTTSIQRIFTDLAEHQSVTAAGVPIPLEVRTWVEMAIALQRLQLGLVAWFDKQPYDTKAGKRLSISTFLTFAVVWSQLSERFNELKQPLLVEGCFQMVLQGLRQFAQQSYFPLYGGLFTALSGEPLRSLLEYLDRPLREVPNTDTKARILTLLGYSQRALGQYDLARQFHERALDSAREVNDQRCEIANLNHLSRTAVMEADFEAAIAHSQRALILSRQAGDRIGEANALANFGYSEISRAQEQAVDPDQIESVLTYLEQGLTLTEQVQDRPSEALCANSLGVAQVMLRHYDQAIPALEKGLQIAQAIGDVFLQGVNYGYLAIAYQHLENTEMAVFCGAMGMYLLWQINSSQWHQPAGTLSILRGQIGPDAFDAALAAYRAAFLKQIGVDGYDYLPQLLAEYRHALD